MRKKDAFLEFGFVFGIASYCIMQFASFSVKLCSEVGESHPEYLIRWLREGKHV